MCVKEFEFFFIKENFEIQFGVGCIKMIVEYMLFVELLFYMYIWNVEYDIDCVVFVIQGVSIVLGGEFWLDCCQVGFDCCEYCFWIVGLCQWLVDDEQV